jgi:hypothetical protein
VGLPTLVVLAFLGVWLVFGVWRAGRPGCFECAGGWWNAWSSLLNLAGWAIGCALGLLVRNLRKLVSES